MRTSYSRGSKSIIKGFNAEGFKTVSQFLKENILDDCLVVGLLSHDSKYGKSYSLAIDCKTAGEDNFFLNIPKYLGEDIEADFIAEGVSAEEYFNNHIVAIEEIKTKNGNTYSFEFSD